MMKRLGLAKPWPGLCLLTALVFSLGSNGAPSAAVVAEIERIASSQGLEVGVAAIHLHSGETVAVNGEKRYPLASTYKVPMAAYAFHRVEEGEWNLDTLITLKPSERMKWSPIEETFSYPGIALSLLNLMEPMLIHSDNMATDVLLNRLGGGRKVTAWLEESGIEGMRIDRTTADLIADYLGMAPDPQSGASMAERIDALAPEELDMPPAARTQAYLEFNDDSRDQGTPLAMAKLLKELWSGELINPEHQALLKDIMLRCETGTDRLSGKLPAYALPIAHKTGSIGGTINDVGVLSLPDGKGEVAIVVYTRRTENVGAAPPSQAPEVIADIARAVYDHFLLR